MNNEGASYFLAPEQLLYAASILAGSSAPTATEASRCSSSLDGNAALEFTAQRVLDWSRDTGATVRDVELSLPDIRRVVLCGSPVLLAVPSGRGLSFLGVVAGGRHRSILLDNELRRVTVPTRQIQSALDSLAEAQLQAPIDAVLEAVPIPPKRRARCRRTLVGEFARGRTFGRAFLFGPSDSSDLLDHFSKASVPGALATFCSAHLALTLFYLGSWWCLGRGAVIGRLSLDWLAGWAILSIGTVAFRALAYRAQWRVAMRAGAVLRKRLLFGALRLPAEEVRRRGVGESMGCVFESDALETMAVSAGLQTALGVIEIAFAIPILAIGAGGWSHACVLLAWVAVAAFLGLRFAARRRDWTRMRIELTEALIEDLAGHRTRLAQGRPGELAAREDSRHASYLEAGQKMDADGALLMSLIPRGWILLGVLSLGSAFVTGTATVSAIAVSLGGVLLAFRAFRKLESGIWDLVGATISFEYILPLLRAAARPSEQAPMPESWAQSHIPADPNGRTGGRQLLLGRNVAFRYPGARSDAVLPCSFDVAEGDRILVTGPSGSGKSTLVDLLSGLSEPDQGVVLLGGLDMKTLGLARWRRQVALAPQFHENYVFSGPLAFNLLFGRQWPPTAEDLEDAEEVCRQLGLGPLLEKMPSGIHEYVGETGWQLSHGERSRVFLGRALLQKPEILVLDESLGSLDPGAALVALQYLRKSRSAVILVTHL